MERRIRSKTMKPNRILLSMLALSLLYTGCEQTQEGTPSRQGTQVLPAPHVDAVEPSALHKMSVVFLGNHSEGAIKEKLDAAMLAYNIEKTERNYERCSSVLVTLRKHNNDSYAEMELLDHMIKQNTGGSGVSFPDQAALSSVMLLSGI
ncbi:MAG: hypothetical protein IPP83_03585 [Flavobacteriales bacterium]|nr:hypothetical protein [Flavobacteriales bacterium]